MISLIETPPDGRERVRGSEVEELWHVEDVEELDAVANIEPHPVSVRL